ncbi:STAS/SEC14 domain-containing protein [Isachenkonia alkalipeptolytica]|nr:STAS/SEC14 domain-containing protein [Isachenkonia alkalipeptolytica]
MVRVINNQGVPVLELEISEKIRKEDYEKIRPALEDKVDKFGEVNILIRMQEFPNFTLGALLEDLKLAVKNYSHMSKVAIVGNDDKLKHTTKLDKVFPGVEMKTFENRELDDAWHWLKT